MKFLHDIDVSNKRVLVRADFNVALDAAGRVLDDFRLCAVLPTIQYLKEQSAKIILMSHLGRPLENQKPSASPGETGRAEVKSQKLSLRPIAQRLTELLGEEVKMAPDCIGEKILAMAQGLNSGEILLLENLRWHAQEEANDAEFAKQLSALGEVYINDAFGVSHRAHASVAAITQFLPSGAGLLLIKEIDNLSRARDQAEHPLCVILGGAKISTKIKLIQSFLGKAENIVLGGALANTVLQAKGLAVGRSSIETEMLEEIKKLEITDTKIHLPVDGILCTDKNDAVASCRTGAIGATAEDEYILDIGPDTEALFKRVINGAKMIIWNGPMGFFEGEKTTHGTLVVAQAVAESSAFSVVGGGETVAFLEKMKLIDEFSFVSTGGGAMMEFLSGETLPGVEALK